MDGVPKCDKCRARLGHIATATCSDCGRTYHRCADCGGEAGVKRSLKSHRPICLGPVRR